MLLSLGSTLVILLITASLAMRKGLYRTTILFFCCLIGAVVAFAFYENFWALLSHPFLQRFGEGLSLMLIFLLVALTLDLLSEQVLTGNMRLSPVVDAVGGGIVGFWTAMLVVGVLCVSIQMLPWQRSAMGFERIYRDKKHRERTRGLLLRPDAFAVGLVGYLSDHIFSGKNSFRSVHPDLLEEVARSNLRVQAESRRMVPPDIETAPSFDVITLVQISDPALDSAKPVKDENGDYKIVIQKRGKVPDDGNRYLVARSKLRGEVADLEDNWHRFTPQQVRMVGTMPNGRVKQYYVAGYREPRLMETIGLVSREQPIMIKGRGEHTFDLLFEVPDDFTPSFVEYKRLGRAEVRGGKINAKDTASILAGLRYVEPLDKTKLGKRVDSAELQRRLKERRPRKPSAKRRPPPRKRPSARPAAKKTAPKPKTPRKPAPKPPAAKKPPPKPKIQKPPPKPPPKPTAKKPPAKPAGDKAKGRIAGRVAQSYQFGDELPFKLDRKAVRGSDPQAQVTGSTLRSGHIYVPAAHAKGDKPVDTFDVPRKSRLLRVECDALHAGSTLGRAVAFAVKTVRQYAVVDSGGTRYLPVGEYRIATIGGKKMMELQYDVEAMPGQRLRRAKHIKENQLKEGSSITLLYFIPPGTQLVEFSTGGTHRTAKDPLKIKAPS